MKIFEKKLYFTNRHLEVKSDYRPINNFNHLVFGEYYLSVDGGEYCPVRNLNIEESYYGYQTRLISDTTITFKCRDTNFINGGKFNLLFNLPDKYIRTIGYVNSYSTDGDWIEITFKCDFLEIETI